ncbi:carboxypeptidase M32 [Ferruginibacter yonginensis]|uniref:Metal-dependent carboxypeptidase n=1 Tax=Ferruginibacter yonginensis TaxID=1310416 RepID=A0ABV8QRN7_9BACT
MNQFSYQQYVTELQKIGDIKYAGAVLQWDQETYLPPKGNDARGRQIATLTEWAHQQFTSEAMGHLLQHLKNDVTLNAQQQRNVALSFEDYERSKKLPSHFVRNVSEAVNKSFHAWIKARKHNDFNVFEAPLQTIINLKKEEAQLIGYDKHPYDALMSEFDRSLTTTIVDALFADLQPQITHLLQQIQKKPTPNTDFLHQHFEKDKQWQLGIDILKAMHFDFEAGRQDISEHPFTTNFSSNDVRVTTRIDEHEFSNMLWSCIHEGGHALYEQGLPENQYGLPLGEYCSLSIHESQSRLWENNIGRSLAFWQHHFEQVKKVFPTQFNDVNVYEFYKAINKVAPSFIRTEADELTYHFHVMIRYEIEKLLIEGTMQAKDIPSYWNELYQKYLGITVTDDVHGCLQDVHWSHGSFGYFATYSVGSLYAAQLFHTIQQQHPTIENSIANGTTNAIWEWLQKNIYPYGRFYTSAELCKQATGSFLNSKYFIDYASKKYGTLYEF